MTIQGGRHEHPTPTWTPSPSATSAHARTHQVGGLSVITACILMVLALLGAGCARAAPGPVVPSGSVGTKSAAPPESAAPNDAPAESDDDVEGSPDDDSMSEGETSDDAVVDAPCPDEMVLVDDGQLRFCIDKYEASLVEVGADGSEQPYAHYLPVDGHTVRAVSRPGVFPQGFISEVQAEDACEASGKRLCAYDEWKTACMGPSKTTFPYGDARSPGTCHDTGKSAVGAVFGMKALASSTPVRSSPVSRPRASAKSSGAKGARGATTTKGRAAVSTSRASRANASKATSTKATRGTTKAGARPATKPATKRGRPGKNSTRPTSVDPSVWTKLNDPALGQVAGALSRTGDHEQCVNGYGAYDLVGNLHEWVATDARLVHGTFAGGYYLDTTLNGDGCRYKTQAHAHDYHDYSTGFRCCAPTRAEAAPSATTSAAPTP